jgi:hypothetical protein
VRAIARQRHLIDNSSIEIVIVRIADFLTVKFIGLFSYGMTALAGM